MTKELIELKEKLEETQNKIYQIQEKLTELMNKLYLEYKDETEPTIIEKKKNKK